MPNINVNRDELFARLGENWGAVPGKESKEADKAFDELCFQFGIELDDVTSEKAMQEKETGNVDAKSSDDIIYVIAIPANRYDLLCIEGVVRALRVFMGKEEPPHYKIEKPKEGLQKMIVKPEVSQIRPFVVCAILRNMKFTASNYKSFIDLQEKLHVNICRRRSLVSIGTHDLDTIKGPFTYEALAPKEIKFAPLNNTTVMDGEQLMKHLETEQHLKAFLPLIRDSPVYPVIYDSNRNVLSLPPIINSDHSKITLNTRNVFIEVTAIDLTKANIVLNTMCAMFAQYTEEKFSVEPVEVVKADGTSVITPDLTTRPVEAQIDYVTSGVGVKLEPETIVKLLHKMSLVSELSQDKKTIKVDVPVTRSDVIHACDIMEDVGIGYGYDNLEKIAPKTVTVGKQQILNKLTDFLRHEIAMDGFLEVLSLSLCSRDENFKLLRRKDDNSAVTIANPKTLEFQIARTTMLVGLLKTVSHNKKAPLPLKVFEISDVISKSDKTDVGSQNKRNMCAIYSAQTSGFEVIHGLLDRVMLLNRFAWKDANKPAPTTPHYYLVPSEDPAFLEGRRADVILNGQKIGVIGVIHPEVLSNYDIKNPCSAFEICVEPFV